MKVPKYFCICKIKTVSRHCLYLSFDHYQLIEDIWSLNPKFQFFPVLIQLSVILLNGTFSVDLKKHSFELVDDARFPLYSAKERQQSKTPFNNFIFKSTQFIVVGQVYCILLQPSDESSHFNRSQANKPLWPQIEQIMKWTLPLKLSFLWWFKQNPTS